MKLTHVLIILILFFSCGGVVGTIKKYEFKESTLQDLRSAVENVYKIDPNLRKPDTSLYGENRVNTYYFYLNDKRKMYILKCDLIDGLQGVGVEVSLTSGTEWGEVLELASNLSFIQKRKYKELFEKYILPKIKNGL